jgi:hypothetical protein
MKKLASLALITLLPVAANAAVVTQTISYSGLPTLNAALVFDKFDSTLGTLTSVQITANLNSSGGDLIMDNDSEEAASGTFSFGADANFAASEGFVDGSFQPVIAPLNATFTGAVNLDPNIGDGPLDFDPTGPDGTQYLGAALSDSDSGFLSSALFAAWTGTGDTVTIGVAASQVSDVSATGGVEIAYTPIAIAGDVTVVYNYATVPEPSSSALLTLGAIGLAARRRRA